MRPLRDYLVFGDFAKSGACAAAVPYADQDAVTIRAIVPLVNLLQPPLIFTLLKISANVFFLYFVFKRNVAIYVLNILFYRHTNTHPSFLASLLLRV